MVVWLNTLHMTWNGSTNCIKYSKWSCLFDARTLNGTIPARLVHIALPKCKVNTLIALLNWITVICDIYICPSENVCWFWQNLLLFTSILRFFFHCIFSCACHRSLLISPGKHEPICLKDPSHRIPIGELRIKVK